MSGKLEESSPDLATDPSGNKRKRIWAACEPCRKRKSKCDGQNPCAGCVSTIKTAMLPINATTLQTGTIDEALVQVKAQELCVFDWNRKPRGPKGKKAAFAAAFGAEASGSGGAPRSHASAGPAYMEAQQRVLDETQHVHRPATTYDTAFTFTAPDNMASHTNSSLSHAHANGWTDATGSAPHGNGAAHYVDYPSTSALAAVGSSSHNSAHPPFPSNGSGRPELYQRSSNDSGSFSASEYSSYTYGPRQPESSTSVSTFSPPIISGHITRPMGTEDRPLKRTTYEYANAPDRVSKASLSAWDALADSASHPRSSSVSSLRRSQNSAGTSPTELYRQGESPAHSQGSGGFPAASPQSDGSVNYYNAAAKLSPAGGDNGDSRFHDQSMLINRLKPYYSEKDRPFVALAISQFEALDSFEKMVPSRYIFGSASGSGGRDPPAHVLLALLAFLAHRALLLPDSMNIEDLDLQAGDVVMRCANNYGRLEGDDRKQMLSFARRSWSLANDLMLQKIRSGDVDPRLIMTGMLLEMGAGEDGVSSKGLVQRKMWLFRLAYCWRLHQLDAKPDSESWKTPWDGPEVLQKALEISGGSTADDPRAPLPRAADTRRMVQDPIELEAIRRQVSLIVTAAYWVQTAEMQVPKFDLYSMEFEPADADDYIHHGSNWTPKVHPASNGYLTQTRDLIFRTYGRLTRLLHTPLADICTGHSPEPDLQHAITEMETTLDWLVERIGSVTYEGPEMPLRVAAFVHARILALLMYRLFTSIQAFFFLFPERTTARTDKSLRIASTLMPKNEQRSNFEMIAGGGWAPESESEDDSAAGRDFQGRKLLPRPQFSRHPMKASMAVLWETGALAKRLLSLHRARDAALEPIEGGAAETWKGGDAEKTGNEVGKTMDASLRAVRWPRHLRLFAQHAYAMAAEAHVAGTSWIDTYGDENPGWKNPASFDLLPEFNNEHIESGLWDTGDAFLELLEAMAKMGSTHARSTEETTLRYRQERWNWAKRYQQPPSGLTSMPNPK
ncbi:potential fungal zinc cluster transcription factor [Pseudozyma hubeiensis SY62]|uniref:Potential fungal zinc cluster transcription factor n=1 Tax=Pseudozyma hubeiensis (strain SY62) TaxID=1305764 RepID=R9P5A8_PSEHS|nr:potential fungal zinc cluster transcription factor [Pseudozyma hubeiensis SY62]GAC96499.1 potential fungal zinc cluster transcription factor [Pseudozyma hubeiensis SY62]